MTAADDADLFDELERMKLWGLKEISRYYAITPQLAKKWTQHSAFPEPYERLAQGAVWLPAQVIAWGDGHRRVKGAGPGPPRRRALET